MDAIDLVLHDWRNLSPEERNTALADIRALAETFPAASPYGAGRRGRALNIVASFFAMLEEEADAETRGRSTRSTKD
jgi:hypothetical protein